MTETLTFQRARKPAEREIRREAILAAAAELFDAEGPQGAGLNAIAARAGFTKSNVYRYFESREEVLLSLLLAELEAFIPTLEQRFIDIVPGDVDAVAETISRTFVERPRLCQLISIVSSVLEQNISEDAVVELKRGLVALDQRAALLLQNKLPGARTEDCMWVVGTVATLLAGMWPGAHPSPAADRVMQRPEFSYLKPNVERDLSRAAKALLKSIA